MSEKTPKVGGCLIHETRLLFGTEVQFSAVLVVIVKNSYFV